MYVSLNGDLPLCHHGADKDKSLTFFDVYACIKKYLMVTCLLCGLNRKFVYLCKPFMG